MVVFLRLNGWELGVEDLDAAAVILQVAEGSLSKDDLAQWIADVARPLPSIELRDFLCRLDYSRLAAAIEAAGSDPSSLTVSRAAAVMPAVHQVRTGVRAAEAAGDGPAASILRQHLSLLTALYLVAEDMGYEW